MIELKRKCILHTAWALPLFALLMWLGSYVYFRQCMSEEYYDRIGFMRIFEKRIIYYMDSPMHSSLMVLHAPLRAFENTYVYDQIRVIRPKHPSSLERQLADACWDGDIKRVNQLILDGADVNYADPDGYTALMEAAICGDFDIVKLLVGVGAGMNGIKMTALSNCADDEKLNKISLYLIEEGVDVNIGDPFTSAAINGNMDLLKVLIKYTDLKVNFDSVLQEVAFEGPFDDFEVYDLLIECGADVNAVAGFGPVLTYVCASAWEELALYFLEHGADPKLKDSDGKDAFFYAKQKGLKKVLEKIEHLRDQ